MFYAQLNTSFSGKGMPDRPFLLFITLLFSPSRRLIGGTGFSGMITPEDAAKGIAARIEAITLGNSRSSDSNGEQLRW